MHIEIFLAIFISGLAWWEFIYIFIKKKKYCKHMYKLDI